MKTYRHLLTVMLLFLGQACLADDYVDSLELVKTRISEIEKKSEYLEHIKKLQTPYFFKKFIESQNANCVSGFEEGGFELAIGISTKGIVEKVYLSKETKRSLCLKEFFLKQTFPKPIVSPMYLYLNML